MRALCVTEGLGISTIAWMLAAFAAMPAAKANLIFTERVSVNELQSAEENLAFAPKPSLPSLAVGDQLTITYEISRPSASDSSDPDSTVYDHVRAIVNLGGNSLFATDQAELTVWNLIGFYGIAVSDFSGPLLDYLASSSPTVLSNGFLNPNATIDDFDSAAGGSVFANGQVIGFQTDSYQISGRLPQATPVPEPSSYGVVAAIALCAAVFGKRLRRHERL